MTHQLTVESNDTSLVDMIVGIGQDEMDGACFETLQTWKSMGEGRSGSGRRSDPCRHPVWRERAELQVQDEPLSITGYANLALGSAVTLSDASIQLLPCTAHDKDLMSPTSSRIQVAYGRRRLHPHRWQSALCGSEEDRNIYDGL